MPSYILSNQNKTRSINLHKLFSLFFKITFFLLFLTISFNVNAADLFSDDFESGDLSSWSSSVTDGNDLSVSTEAKINDDYGLSVSINDTNIIYVQDSTPNTKRYRVRIYINHNSITMPNNGTNITFVEGRSGTRGVFLLGLYYTDLAGYNIRFQARDDGSSYQTADYPITSEAHYIEADWQASTGDGNNDGFASIWIDGVFKGTLSNIDNDTRTITDVRVGATQGFGAGGVNGVYYLDNFASNDDGTEIGAYIEPTPIPTLTPTPTLTTITPTPSNQNNNSVSSSVPSGSANCSDAKPVGSPNLFQIDVNDTQANLFYAPVLITNNYYITYSEKSNTFEHGTETNQGFSTGVLPFTINCLKPNTVYYFRVRGQNGCMTGDWSEEMVVKTRKKGLTNTVPYYPSSLKNFVLGLKNIIF
jgi:hypothetical protein